MVQFFAAAHASFLPHMGLDQTGLQDKKCEALMKKWKTIMHKVEGKCGSVSMKTFFKNLSNNSLVQARIKSLIAER